MSNRVTVNITELLITEVKITRSIQN